MTITQLQQSGTIITSESGQTLGIDIGALTPVEQLADITIDHVLISHIHADHCSAPQVAALAPQMVYTGSECAAALAAAPETATQAVTELTADTPVTIGDFTITPFMVDHGPNTPQVPIENFGFLIEVDEDVVYFAGDMFSPSGMDVTNLSVTAALLPVGGHFTFDAEAALAFAQTFASIGTIYPMHYEAVGPIDTEGGEKFKVLAADTFIVAN